jgi:hypothetical protein
MKAKKRRNFFKEEEKLLFCAPPVSYRTEHRSEQRYHNAGNGICQSKPGCAYRCISAGTPVLFKKYREKPGNHRRGKC